MNDIKNVIDSLNNSGFRAVYAKDADEAVEHVLSIITKMNTVGVGGSVTLNETGVLDALLLRGNKIFSGTIAKKLGQDKEKARQDGMSADVYLSSTNAVTSEGDLINIDAVGNRTAAMFYGPKKVVIVAGKNKITDNPMTAVTRIKKIACPQNARRLNLNTPCAVTGECEDCSSSDRMCNVTTRIQQPTRGKEIHVILIDGDFGY